MKKLTIIVILVLTFILFSPQTIFAGNAPAQVNSHYYLPSGWAASDGNSTETVSMILRDANNLPVVGDSVSLSSSNNNTAVFSNSQTTDSTGNVSFTVTSTNSGTTNITLTDTTNNIVFADWFSVQFNPPGFGCINIPAAPVLSSVVSNSNNTATLTWVDSPNPVSNYLISYGIESGKYIYGNANVGGQGTTNYTVGSLSGNKKYYFVVAASNNCGASSFSNEVSTTLTLIPTPIPTIVSTPIPTPIATPVQTQTPTNSPQPVSSDVNNTFVNFGIGVIVAGVLIIGSVLVFRRFS